MLFDVLDRVEERLRKLGLSATAASKLAGLNEDAIRNMRRAAKNDGRRGVSTRTIEALAPVLQTTAGWLMGDDSEATPVASSSGVQSVALNVEVPVVGRVQAGAWSEAAEERTEFTVPLSLPGYERADLFGLRVVGESMNLVFPEGTVLICIPTAQAGVRENDYVIVRRTQGALVETTVKQVARTLTGVALWPRSNSPDFQQPLLLDAKPHADEGAEIVGVVVTHVPPLLARAGPILQF